MSVRGLGGVLLLCVLALFGCRMRGEVDQQTFVILVEARSNDFRPVAGLSITSLARAEVARTDADGRALFSVVGREGESADFLVQPPAGMLLAAQLLRLLSERRVALLMAFVAGSLLHLVTGHLARPAGELVVGDGVGERVEQALMKRAAGDALLGEIDRGRGPLGAEAQGAEELKGGAVKESRRVIRALDRHALSERPEGRRRRGVARSQAHAAGGHGLEAGERRVARLAEGEERHRFTLVASADLATVGEELVDEGGRCDDTGALAQDAFLDMAKKKVAFATTEPVHDHQRGVIQDNHLE